MLEISWDLLFQEKRGIRMLCLWIDWRKNGSTDVNNLLFAIIKPSLSFKHSRLLTSIWTNLKKKCIKLTVILVEVFQSEVHYIIALILQRIEITETFLNKRLKLGISHPEWVMILWLGSVDFMGDPSLFLIGNNVWTRNVTQILWGNSKLILLYYM